ncbi:FHA domain-containing protein [Rhodoferax sp.]|uniref:FHA domain-containing protein n=1 Tax=Rhodoferax sp. TaxID=50421 RepID=UPI00261E0651|nr:FHA domain-containing protein [Rhodoferax sp.]MDD2810561.1 FHA domain-containing protein [Rhodoferax sp.]
MPKLIVTIDDVVIKEVQLTKDKTTVGRRPYNDIVIDNLAVSGEHAVLYLVAGQVTAEDVGSTNGTFVNGKAIKKQLLAHGDVLELGKYKLKFEGHPVADDFEKTMLVKARPAASPAPVMPVEIHGAIKVVSGPAAGREMTLTKIVTTIGKPGVAVAAITKRQHHFQICHVEGGAQPKLNGVLVGTEPVVLKSGDQIELAGTQMQFIQS